MSFEGQVLCQRMLIGPCALTTVGAATFPTAAAPATSAPVFKNLRREHALSSVPMGSPPETLLHAHSYRASGIPRPHPRKKSPFLCIKVAGYGVGTRMGQRPQTPAQAHASGLGRFRGRPSLARGASTFF